MALKLAHAHLSYARDVLSPSSSSSSSRQTTYHALLAAFLSHPHGTQPAISLLERMMEENPTLSADTLDLVLDSGVLDSAEGRRLPTVTNPTLALRQVRILLLSDYGHGPARAQTALKLAHAHLSSSRDVPPPSSPSSSSPQSTYHALLKVFLTHPYGGPPALSLLDRMLEESVPLTAEIAELVLRSGVLDSVERLLPHLPNPLPAPLLAQVLHAMVRETSPSQAQVRDMIDACLAVQGDDAPWHWDLWGVLLAAYPASDLRGALATLTEFRGHVVAEQEALGEASTLSDEQVAAVVAAYTTVMKLWLRARYAGPSAARAAHASPPSRLAADLGDLLGEQQPLPAPFLNAWLAAEVAGHNLDAAAGVWTQISGHSVSDIVAGLQPPRMPDPGSYVLLLKLLRAAPPTTYAHVAELMLQSHANAPAANALLGAIARRDDTADIPLLLTLVRALHPRIPDTRTTDIVASGVVRALRGARLARAPLRLPGAMPPFPDSGVAQVRSGRAGVGAAGVSMDEWRWVSSVLGAGLPPLPLSRPLAAVGGEAPQTTSDDALVVETHRRVFGAQESAANAAKVPAVIEALGRLLEVLVVADARRSGAEGPDDEVLALAMAPVERMLRATSWHRDWRKPRGRRRGAETETATEAETEAETEPDTATTTAEASEAITTQTMTTVDK
ncbi:uncharacterized protein LOC62_04G006073 [Vanrija pseudolonga]|uniref:Uncharacterized protein n=1 Tax=Vanrija pseudolonga TaxID=143232 RepID=A0AAF0YDN7_9TREE|nr:hypothetical protein LOC62_04G006073 [Vanrija pseudolonga]